jgi:DNA-binding NtrC family response regulator
MIGSGPAMQRIAQLLQKTGPSDTPVLISGASGTGKGLVARALHGSSQRRDRPFVTVHCAGVEESLLENELFDREAADSTGTPQNGRGLIAAAEGGTLFIDKVAELCPGVQAKLLRLLEDGHYRRAGSTREVRADVRVLAATNRPLEREVMAGRFREDLYYRLNVVTIELPPLREHPEDVPELVEHFLRTRAVGPTPHGIHPDALEALLRYDWPGNVRELANVLDRAQMLAGDQVITLDDLPASLVKARSATASESSRPRHLREVERRHVLEVLREEKWNKLRAATALGISRRALYRLIEKYRLEENTAGSDLESQKTAVGAAARKALLLCETARAVAKPGTRHHTVKPVLPSLPAMDLSHAVLGFVGRQGRDLSFVRRAMAGAGFAR